MACPTCKPYTRKLWHSSNGGLTWQPTSAYKGSIVYHQVIAPGDEWDDGFGNLYRNEHPDEVE